MAHQAIPTPTTTVNTETYRLAGSCSVRAYVACDDTPYHLEQPVTRTVPNPSPNHTPERAAMVRALISAANPAQRRMLRTVGIAALIDANPAATVAELLNLISQ